MDDAEDPTAGDPPGGPSGDSPGTARGDSPGDTRGDSPEDTVAANRARQREIYGEPLGERVRRLTGGLRITQARLAASVGLSPAMLSQLSGARRVKIGDPAVLGRLAALDRRVASGPVPDAEVETLLAAVRAGTTPWGTAGRCVCGAGAARTEPPPRRPPPTPTADDALRRVSDPARLVAAAAALAPGFPEIAEVLRRAAARR